MASTKLILPQGVNYNGQEGEVDLKNLPHKSSEELGAIGDSGTVIYSGIISDIDYVAELEDESRFDVYDRMRLGDATIGPALRARKSPILAAEDGFKPASEDPIDIEIKEFVEWNLKDRLTDINGMRRSWDDVKKQTLDFLEDGVAVNELVWGGWQDYNGKQRFVLQDMAPRLPRTIDYWWLKTKNPENGQFGIQQSLDGGDGIENTQPFIPLNVAFTRDVTLRKLTITTNRKKGDNFQGYSELRNAYGSWIYKKNLYKFDSIKHEKQSMGIVYAIIPQNFPPASKTRLENQLKNVRNNSQLHMMIVANKDEIEFGFVDMKAGTTTKPIESARVHDDDIARALGVGFLMNRTVGSQAKQVSEQKFFLMLAGQDKEMLESTINNQTIPSMVDANFQNVEKYPTYFIEKIRMDDIKEFAEATNKLTQSKLIMPDRELINLARKKVGVPELSEDEFKEMEKRNAEIEKARNDVKLKQEPVDDEDEKDKSTDKEDEDEIKKKKDEGIEATECGSKGDAILGEEIANLILETRETIDG